MKKATICEVLKILMFKQNIKAAQLAREVNLPQQTIHRIVAGISPRPHITSLIPIANFFDISVDQLKGKQPLTQTQLSMGFPTEKPTIKNIPLIDWKTLNFNFDVNIAPKLNDIFVDQSLNARCFALTMNDTSMEPYIPYNSTLIFDPEKRNKDRSFVLAMIKESGAALFRQLLIDGEYMFLKPLNPDLNVYAMRMLGKDDIILAGLIEFRHLYEDL